MPNLNWVCSECRHDNHRDCKGTVGGDTCSCQHKKKRPPLTQKKVEEEVSRYSRPIKIF